MTSLTNAYPALENSKFSIEPRSPISTPGVCGTCGTNICEQGFVNLGLDFEFYGTLIICRTCIIEMSAIYGLISCEQAEELSIELQESRNEVDKLRCELIAAKQVIDGFVNGWVNLRIDDSSSTGVLTHEEPESKPIEPSSKSIDKSVRNKSETIKPSSGERLFDL